MRLWLDDERDPTDKTIQRDFGAKGDEVWVRSAPEAIKHLQTGNVAYISLDHDLGPYEGSGQDVANWIERAVFDGTIPILSWDVHTMNPVGAKSMMRALMNAERFWNERHGIKE